MNGHSDNSPAGRGGRDGLPVRRVALGLLAALCLAACTSESPVPAGGAAQRQASSEQAGARQPATPTAPAAEPAAGDPTPTEPETHGAGPAAANPAADDPRYVLAGSMNRIQGQPEPLDAYRGKVVLVVNVASACGLTPQYEALQALYESKADAGLVVLGFPANNFGNQEPGSNKDIQEFCTGEYHVTFPMFEKISVVGEDQHPLYQRLSQEGGPPSWNFTKYLVDRQGRVVARFEPGTKPDDPALLARIDELLGG